MKRLLLAAATIGAAGFVMPVSAQESMAQAQVDALEGLFGKHAGARRSGAIDPAL